MGESLPAVLDPLCQFRKFHPGQVVLDGRMGRRLADEQEMPACRPHRLADRLAGVEIVAEIDGIEPCIAWAMGGEPASRRHALAVLLVVPILRHDELRLQRYDPAMAWRYQRRGHQRMEIFD